MLPAGKKKKYAGQIRVRILLFISFGIFLTCVQNEVYTGQETVRRQTNRLSAHPRHREEKRTAETGSRTTYSGGG